MSIKKFVAILFVSLTFVFSQQSYASLSTRVRICAVKGTVQTGPAVSGGHQGDLYTCPLKQTLDQTECRVVNVATMVETGHDGFAIVEYPDGTKIKIKPDTKLVLSQNNIYVAGGETWFNVEKQKDGKLIIKTPTAIAGIRGTEFLVNVEENGATNIQLIEGNIGVSDINRQSTINLSAGMEVTVATGSSVLNAKLLKIKENDKWWTNWPTLVPITEKPGYGGMTDITNGEQQIPASADAYVYAYDYRNWNRSNRGKYKQLVAGWHPTGGESRAYIRFDLNGISPASVRRAVLRLYHTATYGDDGVKLGIYRVSDPWMEGWDTYHSGQVEKTAGPGVLSWVQQPVFNGSVMATFNPGMTNNNWVEVDVTPLVNEWLAGFKNNGLLIKPAGNVYSGVPESTYHFASREVVDKNHRPVLILNGPPVTNPATSTHITSTPITSAETAVSLDAMRWQPHSNGSSVCNVVNNQLCIRSQQAGGAWFTTSRPYGFGKDYSVSFDVKLNTANNHFPVLYSDGFVFVEIDWGTTLGHYQPGLAYGLKQVENLAVNRWYHIRVAAHPAKKSFDLFLDGRLISTATNIRPLHSYYTYTSMITRKDIIYFGDADSPAINGGSYNHGDVCWRNIRVNFINNIPVTKPMVENVWAVNQSNRVFRWKGNNWAGIAGLATDIGVGAHGTVWIIGKQNVLGGYDIERWMETQFVKVQGGAVRVDVGPWGTPWVVNTFGDIFYWKNKVWNKIPGKATDIGVGADGTVWVLGNKAVFGGFEIFRWTGSTFVKIPGAGVRIDVDPNGNPWIVNAFGVVYRWKNNNWEALPGRAKDISVGIKGSVWIIGTNSVAGGYGIYRWNEKRRNWDRIPGGAAAISVGGMQAGNITNIVPGKFSNAVAFNHNILGQWKWFTGSVVTIYSDGKVKSSDGYSGTWAKNGSPDNFIIHWVENGAIDQLILKGDNLNGRNQNGTVVSARKIITTKKSGRNTVQNTAIAGKLFNQHIVGQWKWSSGSVISIYPDGRAKSSDGNTGTWTTGSSTDIFVIHWVKGQNVDRLQLKGDNLKGKNQKGAKVSAKKIVVDLKSGKYRVEQYTGTTYKSEWKIQVKKGKITGKSEWSCCPGRRIDPVRGYINGYTVVIERDCSGQNRSGACRQKFVGTLMGSKVEGTCTGTGIVGTGHWVLFLK